MKTYWFLWAKQTAIGYIFYSLLSENGKFTMPTLWESVYVFALVKFNPYNLHSPLPDI